MVRRGAKTLIVLLISPQAIFYTLWNAGRKRETCNLMTNAKSKAEGGLAGSRCSKQTIYTE